MSTQFIIIIILATLLIGLSKGGLGGPVPVALTTPLLSIVMPVAQAVSLALPLLIMADVLAIWAYWRLWDMRYVRLMLLPSVVGVAMGVWLLASLPDAILRPILGIFTLLVIVYKVASDRLKTIQYQPRDWHGYLAGWASGFASALANTGAPPFTAYMLLQRVTPITFIGTGTLFFAIVNILKLPGVIQAGLLDFDLLLQILWVIPLIPLGVWVGRKLVERFDPKTFENFMLLLLAGACLFLIFGTPPTT
ncbi:MAG: sulfite exporter TauE/SafE family protein [Anaerolineae bacterium]|nr:sulfite exporter TauE/SafE family protein [Anaerolineae bacterium]